jgi:Pentapeptide repeats (8 copies)
MDRSRLVSERAIGFDRDDITASGLSGWRWPLIVIGTTIVGGIWFFQQTSLRHLDERIHQLGQDIDKLPNRSLSQIDRLSLEKEQIVLERDRINAQNGVYNLLFQGVGLSLLGGLAYASWHYLRRADVQFQTAEDKSIADRFSQAISHLASDKMAVRLGGIYTLERLAQDAPSEYWLTIEVLTAFVRERAVSGDVTVDPVSSQLPTVPSSDRPSIVVDRANPRPASHKQPALPRIPTDIQAVMTVLSRRDVSRDRPDRTIELRESNLRAADMSGIDLWGADLWKVNLREAQLWKAKLIGAFLGRANLSEASLWSADLEGAYLWKTNLQGANLSEANLSQANLEGSNLKGANLHHTNLINADLRKVVGLTRQQLSTAICDETTLLPDYLEFITN